MSAGERDFCSALEEMTRVEVAAREARIVRQRIRSSGFPYVKGLADFDWDFQPSVPRARVEELATLRFIERAENVLLVGSPGVGKTRLAVAIGIEAVRAGREVRFMDCARLVEDLQDAQARGILRKRLKYYAHSKLLVIDELGYLDIGEGGVNARLRAMLRDHRGLSVERRLKAIFWWCYAHSPDPLPAAEILRVMPTDRSIAAIYDRPGERQRLEGTMPQRGDVVVWSELHHSEPYRMDWD